jgi:hypothetical protein
MAGTKSGLFSIDTVPLIFHHQPPMDDILLGTDEVSVSTTCVCCSHITGGKEKPAFGFGTTVKGTLFSATQPGRLLTRSLTV